MSLPVLASEILERSIWYPTILGILVVVFATLLFVGSIYLLLGTNVGGRLALLVTFTALSGFMVLLSGLWVTTASPLNTIKGRIPAWEVLEVVEDPSLAQTTEVHDIIDAGRKVDEIEAANVKASVDENLVTVQALPNAAEEIEQKFARFAAVTDYLTLDTYEIGGSQPNPLEFELTHTPLYAVVEFCEVKQVEVVFGTAPPAPECAASSNQSGFVVLQRDLGSLRVPPTVALGSSILLFVLGLLALHWREKDEAEAKRRAEGTPPSGDGPSGDPDANPGGGGSDGPTPDAPATPEPANA